MKSLEQAWYSNAWWLVLLTPLSALFGMLSRWRRRRYQQGRLQIIKAPVPVIVVGNITVGGTGKTPVVIALVKAFQQQGLRPAVVSRGYGAINARFPQWVTATTPVSKSGDEALLIARHTGVPVVTDPDRPRAVKTLLESGDCNIIISDDGLQHYALGRQLEIVVVDGSRGLGNGRLLPAGPLREPPARLREADMILVNGEARQGLQASIRALNNNVYQISLQWQSLTSMHTGESMPVADFSRQNPVHAVAGIGNPDRFFDSLRNAGFAIIPHSFPDHHAYTADDLEFGDGHEVIMTEKDAVKCQAFNTARCWYLETAMNLPDALLEALTAGLDKNKS